MPRAVQFRPQGPGDGAEPARHGPEQVELVPIIGADVGVLEQRAAVKTVAAVVTSVGGGGSRGRGTTEARREARPRAAAREAWHGTVGHMRMLSTPP